VCAEIEKGPIWDSIRRPKGLMLLYQIETSECRTCGKRRHAMSESKFHEWQHACLQALLEPLGSPTLAQRVKEAETAVSRRIQELRASRDGNSDRQALANALRSLRYVRNENFKFSTIGNVGQAGDAT